MARFSDTGFVNNALNFAAMELFLNLLWLAIASGSLFTYVSRRAPSRDRFHLGLGALACALVFLLPAISITDDLHVNAIAVEDGSLSKRLIHRSAPADTSSHVAWLQISFQSRLAIRLPSADRTHVTAAVDFLPGLTLRALLPERAPPLACA